MRRTLDGDVVDEVPSTAEARDGPSLLCRGRYWVVTTGVMMWNTVQVEEIY